MHGIDFQEDGVQFPFDPPLISPQIASFSSASVSKSQNISFFSGGKEMLKIAPDGFYVRGVKLPQDETEVRAVFDAFKDFLAVR